MLQLIKILISSCTRMLITVLKGYAFVSESNEEPNNKADGKSPIDEMAWNRPLYVYSSLSKVS